MEKSRRNFIKNSAIASALVATAPAKSFAILHKDMKSDDQTIGQGGFTYKADKNWAKISVNSNPLANCHEMVQDSKGRLIMLGDHTNNNILIFDKSGKLLDYWGTSLPGGHGLSISKEGGEDFLLLTDCGWALDRTGANYGQSGQVLKTTLDGKLIFAIGHPRTIGIYKDDEPFKPTETAVAPNGDIYVADGYGSDYIIQYNSKGQYIRHFGGHHNANKDHNLVNAHGVSVDTRDKNNPTLICTSREENCFKIFTLDGKFIKKIDMPGMYVCRAVINDSNIYAGVCWSKNAEGKRFDYSGFVTVLDADNKVVSNPGGAAPVYKNGVLQQTLQASNPIFQHGHDVCVDEDKNVYVCQWNAYHTAPVKLTRV
ncbi:twin-arginine translocation signal domain-containing protein [Mucilaginibacter sabulilitoris]|uniref:Twin-arginine translocation signal domain-containing protein n=1 Tax=Mucilaginibacter sabulilitoris TaxID=1173583 RepID=A0ABZ0TJB4_9SPHI|nr:twin-arginine translocation signal domain-containing protein [Mucilaginibacter sabulilitoris]WPU92273.1 twin-arginine translocation signal domain-containing protein [Mucilaginibacter sabulilitoris]